MHFVHKRASAASLTFPLASFTLAFTGTISSLKRPAWIHSTMSSIQPGATGFIERGKQILEQRCCRGNSSQLGPAFCAAAAFLWDKAARASFQKTHHLQPTMILCMKDAKVSSAQVLENGGSQHEKLPSPDARG